MKKLEVKIEEAGRRKKIYDKLSPKEKIAKLDKKLGKGIGAKKERQRLLEKSKKGGTKNG